MTKLKNRVTTQKNPITIYVVEGITGEYEDYRTWQVAAYKSKAKAEKKVEEATNEVARLLSTYPSAGNAREAIRKGKDINKADPSMQLDCTGTEYYIRTITTDD